MIQERIPESGVLRWVFYGSVLIVAIVGGLVGGLLLTPGIAGVGSVDPSFSIISTAVDQPQETIREVQTDPTRALPVVHNPWGERTITVAVQDGGSPRPYGELTQEALTYWNANMSALSYEGSFAVAQQNVSNPDVVVKFVESVDSCGIERREGGIVGCAPVHDRIAAAALSSGATTVRIETGYRDSAIRNTLIHEFGHTLGLRHTDAVEWPLMEASIAHPTLPQPGVTERANPWEQDTISVAYTNIESAEDADSIRSQLDAAIAYYNDGAEGYTPDGVSFTRVADPSNADITIRVNESLGTASTGRWRGYDPDSDDSLESYSHGEIEINPRVDKTWGWHAAYWLGSAFGVSSDSELPPPVDNPQSDDRQYFAPPVGP